MTPPVSKVDERFSQKDEVATPWETVRDVIESAELFWVTSVRANGHPHMTPLVAVWNDDALYFSTGEHEQKTLNLKTNPHVILSTGSNEWTSGMDVVVEGDAVRVSDNDKLTRLAQAWTTKWDGDWNYEVANGSFFHPGADVEKDEKVLVFEVRPTKVLSFTKGTFNHTSHRF
jgi:general stress protein 26